MDNTWRLVGKDYNDLLKRPPPRHLRNVIEMALLLGGGTAWYWLDRERQVADWDFPSVKDRVTFEAWRFDNNPFGINFLGHPINGVGFHTLSRSNNLGLLSSIGVGFATSMVWEFGLEFREKISINDVLVTTGAGVAVGEFMHWLGRYLNSAPQGGNAGNRIASWTLGGHQALHNAIDGQKTPERTPTDSLGFSAHIWHRFRLAWGFSPASARTPVGNDSVRTYRIGLSGKLVAIPGYLRPGKFHQWFRDGNVTRMAVHVTTGQGSSVELSGDTILIGFHRQDIPRLEQGGTGEAITGGLSVAYEYRDETFAQWHDRLGILHFPGPAIDLHLFGSNWHFVFASRFHTDFAGVHARLHDQWRTQNPSVNGKTILEKQGYYYGFGASGRVTARLRTPWIGIGGAVFHGRYFSQEGVDRTQEDLDVDQKLSDTILDYQGWIRIPISRTKSFLAYQFVHRQRGSSLESLRSKQSLRLHTLQFGFEF